MAENRRDIFAYVATNPNYETVFSDIYAEVDGNLPPRTRSWTDLTTFTQEGEYSYVLFSSPLDSDSTQVNHELYPNSQLEWWGTSDEPYITFTTQAEDDMLAQVKQKIGELDLNLLESTRRVNILIMNPATFGIDTDMLRRDIRIQNNQQL